MYIDIVFTKSKKKLAIGSWLIRALTMKRYSHCAIRFSSQYYASNYFYQASDGLVNYMSEWQFHKKHNIVKIYRINVSEAVYHEIKRAAFVEAGADYGIMQNVGIALLDVLKLVGIKISNPWKKGRNCSELIYDIVIKHTLGDLGYDSDTIKPYHVEKILNKYYKTVAINN